MSNNWITRLTVSLSKECRELLEEIRTLREQDSFRPVATSHLVEEAIREHFKKEAKQN